MELTFYTVSFTVRIPRLVYPLLIVQKTPGVLDWIRCNSISNDNNSVRWTSTPFRCQAEGGGRVSPGDGGEWSRRLPYRRRICDVTGGAMRRSAQVLRMASSVPHLFLPALLIMIPALPHAFPFLFWLTADL